ncbi:MAG: SHOCT-like domain-containing protein [Chloroflexota bacterium]
MTDERLQILQMIEENRITPQEGIKLLEALSGVAPGAPAAEVVPAAEGVAEVPPPVEGESAAPLAPAPDLANLRRLWLIPLALGGLLGTIGLVVTVLVQIASPGSFALICGLMPILLGVGVVLLAFWSHRARWLHVRIRGEQRISLSFPLPLRLTGWILRLARPYVPQLRETALDELILSLDEGLASGAGGFYVDVQDDQDGEQVQVYIG